MQGLAQLHDWHILHGDVQPENITVKIVWGSPYLRLVDQGQYIKVQGEASITENEIFPQVDILWVCIVVYE
jgi:hypothetical protein